MRPHCGRLCGYAQSLLVAALILFSFVTLPAERTGYPPEEFTARRKALASALGQGTVVLFGKTMPAVSVRFRQDNDFYYFTGNEDLNAVFVMDAATAASWLFLPAQSAGEIRSDGKNWLTSGEAQARGFEGILPLTELNEFLARRRVWAERSADALDPAVRSRTKWTADGATPQSIWRAATTTRLARSRAKTAGAPTRCARVIPPST